MVVLSLRGPTNPFPPPRHRRPRTKPVDSLPCPPTTAAAPVPVPSPQRTHALTSLEKGSRRLHPAKLKEKEAKERKEETNRKIASQKAVSIILRREATKAVIEKKKGGSKKLLPRTVLEALHERITALRWDSALKVFDLLREQIWYKPNSGVYIKLIVMLGKCKQPEKASSLFELMIDEGCVVNTEAYTALLSAYSRSGIFDKAFSLLEEMKNTPDCRPDVFTYSILIKSLLQFYKFNEIEALLADMASQGIRPNTVTYNTLIDAYGKAKRFVDMESTLAEMLRQKNCKPDVWTMNSTLRAFGGSGQIEMMERCYEKFQSAGIEPSIKTFNILLDSYGKTGNYEKMSAVMEYMQKYHFRWTIVTYNIVIDAFGRVPDLKQMEFLFRLMQSERIKPNCVTLCSLVRAYGQTGKAEKIGGVLRFIENSNVTLDTVFFNCLVDAYGMMGCFTEMKGVLEMMGRKGCKPDKVTYKTMMKAYFHNSSCLLSSSNFLFSSLPYASSQRYAMLFSHQSTIPLNISSFPANLPFNSVHIPQPALFSIHSTATKDVEANQSEFGFIDVGYICSVHGLRGEVRVKPSTDFPELRFSKPGRRWLKQQVSGRELLQEINLVEGRGHAGQQSWIVKFNEIDTVEEALKLVGSTIMVSEQDRPELEEGEFYTHDLVGMRVILKETGESVGTVVSVFNTGASDLLHVKCNSLVGKTGKTKQEVGNDGPLAWIPFVQEIVPDVDINKREMRITPPKGLLELNIRSDERSKKERRLLEWKERKKFQKRVIAAKKKLCELEQKHVFDGFRHGEKSQAKLLAEQIVAVNSKLLQQALQKHTVRDMHMKIALEVVEKCFRTRIKQQSDSYSKLQEKGLFLTSHGKVATILVLEDSEEPGQSCDHVDSDRNEATDCLRVEELLSQNERLVKAELRPLVPLILVCPTHMADSLQELFSDCNYFSFDSDKVWFLEEEKLPVVSTSLEEPKRHKILMKSPWEILQTPVGSGGVISLLSSNKLLDDLSTLGVEYVEVCNNRFRYGNREALVGLVDSCKANVGVEVFKDLDLVEEDVHIVFSVKFMKKLLRQMSKLHFEAIPMANPYTEKVEKVWVDVVPSSPNSLEFRSSIYSCLNSCSSNEISILEVN